MVPYSRLFSSSSPSAPISRAKGRRNSSPTAVSTRPQRMEAKTVMEKSLSAFSALPSPMVLAIDAPPPVPNMKPTPPRIIRKGIIRFTAAKGVLPV